MPGPRRSHSALGSFLMHALYRTPATQSEIEIWLRDRLRDFALYSRLRSITVWPTDATGSGWNGEVVGDFTVPEQVQANDILTELQRRFSLKEGR